MRFESRHIVLIGFMGSGKTTIGKHLAYLTKRPFIDLDSVIEKRENMKINDIFALKGEDYFRQIEAISLKMILKDSPPAIIATGGGTPCFFDNMQKILNNGKAIYLKVGVFALFQRLKHAHDRPILHYKAGRTLWLFIKEKMKERKKYYQKAHKTVLANRPPEMVAQRILKVLKQK